MPRRLANLTLDTLVDLPRPCRGCVFWELEPAAAQDAYESGDPGLEKEAWVSQTLLEWGSCGRLVSVDGDVAGYVMYAPPSYLPRAGTFPTAPVSADAALLTTVHVVPLFAGSGFGRMLVQAAARDIAKRGIRAVEAFADTEPGEPDPTGVTTGRCLAPVDFYLAVGFKTVAPHPRFPRLRLELRSTESLQSDVDYALDSLLGLIRTEAVATAPAGTVVPAGPSAVASDGAGSQASAVASAARSSDTSIDPVGTSDSTG